MIYVKNDFQNIFYLYLFIFTITRKLKIYKPDLNRRCNSHVLKNKIAKHLGLLRVHSNTASLSTLELSKVMETLSLKCDSSLLDKGGAYRISENQLSFHRIDWEKLDMTGDMMTSL